MNLKQELQNMVNEFKLKEQRKLEVKKGRAILFLPSITDELLLKIKKAALLGEESYSIKYSENNCPDTFLIANDIVNHFKKLGLKAYYREYGYGYMSI